MAEEQTGSPMEGTDSIGDENEVWPDVWSTPCKTRGDDKAKSKGEKGNGISTSLKFTKDNDIISGCIIDKESPCGSPEFFVENTIKGDTLQIFLTEKERTGEMPDCMCTYDIYFTIRDALKDRYYLQFYIGNWKVDKYDGWISFEESSEIVLKPAYM
jgi:hypothetical protein